MKISRPMLVPAFLIASTLIAQDARVTPLMSKDLAEVPGKEGLMVSVVYPPGASDPIHRHNAHAFLYVLEGSVCGGPLG
jgi:quercetin dioxygenase-like cupin family protein